MELVQKALRANGISVEDVTAQAFGCLLESARKFALELITDAVDYSMATDADYDSSSTVEETQPQAAAASAATVMEEITPADLQLAFEMQGDNQMSSEENLYHLTQIADEVNRSILPPIPDHCYNGIVLPPPEHNLLGRTFDVISRPIEIENVNKNVNVNVHTDGIGNQSKTVDAKSNNNDKLPQSTAAGSGVGNENENHNQQIGDDGTMNKNINQESNKKTGQKRSAPSYGARSGQQIEIKLNNNKTNNPISK